MKCANSWRRSVSSTNALINASVVKAKTSNTAGNVSTSIMSSSKEKEDIVDCHWCYFVFCFFIVCCYYSCVVLLILLLLFYAVFLLIDMTHERPGFGVSQKQQQPQIPTIDPRPSKNLEGSLWILHKFHSLCSRF
jgi:hypothetical protein